MKTIQAKDMTDEPWQSFTIFENNLMREYYPQYWFGKDKNWEDVKNQLLNEVSLIDDSYSNSFYIFRHDKIVEYIDAYERRNSLYFVYNFSGDLIESDLLFYILFEIKNLLAYRNKNNA